MLRTIQVDVEQFDVNSAEVLTGPRRFVEVLMRPRRFVEVLMRPRRFGSEHGVRKQ